FGSGNDFSADDFVLTDTGSNTDLDDPFFDLDGSNADLTNDCISNDLFANGTGVAGDNFQFGCLDAQQLAAANFNGQDSNFPLQLLMSQMATGTQWGLSCINVAYMYERVVNQDPQLGFVLAMAGITD